jgi:ABC-type sugar transport system permease subunit
MLIRRAWPARVAGALRPLLWVGPAVALIAVVVLWPVVVLIQSSFQNIAADGFVVGGAGWKNYSNLWHEPALHGVVLRTVIWVVAVVAVTLLLSLALAQLFNQRFPFRRAARTALIAPWAASVLMTALIFRWALDPNVGAINIVLHALGIVHRMGSSQADWLGHPVWALFWMMVVAIFVSLPFTTYALLSGLQTIPDELHEAARVDGAGRWHAYRTITLPLLRPALLVASTINVINVFNSFPIIWEMTRGGPGYEDQHDHDVHVHPQAGVHRRGGRHVRRQLPVGDCRRPDLPQAHPLEGAGELSMSAVSSPSLAAPSEAVATAGPPVRRPLTRRTFVLSILAYGIAVLFLLPYLEMVIAALRPNAQLLSANLLPSHFTFRNFTTIWQTGFGGNLGASLLIAGGATVVVLLVSVPAAYYSARHRFRGRSLFLLLVLGTQMFDAGSARSGRRALGGLAPGQTFGG